MTNNGYDTTMSVNNEIMNTFAISAQSTYAPVIRDTFYTLVPSNFKFYYLNTIRRCLYWFQGYVPEVHKSNAGIFSTGIGGTVIEELTKLTISSKVFFENRGSEKSKDKRNNPTLKKFNEWSNTFSFQDTIKQIVKYGFAGGTCLFPAYVSNDRQLITRPFRIDQCFYDVDFSGHCTAFTGFMGSYTPKISNGQGRNETDYNYYIVEKRFFNEMMQPIMRFSVHTQCGNISTGLQFDITNTTEAQWAQLPKNIQNKLKRDFPGVKFGIDQPITFAKDIAVFVFKATIDNRIPEIKMGEPLLLPTIGYCLEYEMEEAHFVTDMYISKGKVLVPEEMTNPTDSGTGSPYSGFDQLMYTLYPTRNASEQKPLAVQFDMRSQEHQRNRNNICEKIASAVGVAGSDLFSFLRDAAGGSKTATQIAAESQKTISFIYEKRSIIETAFEPFLKLWKEFYHQPDDIRMRFSSQNMVNKMVTIDEMRMLKEIGYSIFDLYKRQEPDLDDDQITEMVERHYEEQRRAEEMKADVQASSMARTLKGLNGNRLPNGLVEKEETEETDEIKENEETKPTIEGASSDRNK